MGKKRKHEDSEERIRRKLKKYNDKLESKLKLRRRIIYSSEDDDFNNTDLAHCDDPDVDMPSLEATPREPLDELPTDASPPPRFEGDDQVPVTTGLDIPAPVPLAAETSTSANVAEEVELDHQILELLGEAPEPEITLGKSIHKDVAARWLDIIKKGLNKEVKDKLAKHYLIPSNCELLIPPILNAEAKAALSEPFIKRDASLVYRQKQIAIALAALAPVVDIIISKDCTDNLRNKLLKPVSDACRIMCDMHHNETRIRKKFVISSISSGLKDTLVNASTDKYLFGDNMTEKIKTAKNVQRSGEALKIQAKVQSQKPMRPFQSNRLNYKPLHQKSANKYDAGRNQTAPRQQRSGRSAPTRRGPAPPPAPDRSPPSPPPPRRRQVRR